MISPFKWALWAVLLSVSACQHSNKIDVISEAARTDSSNQVDASTEWHSDGERFNEAGFDRRGAQWQYSAKVAIRTTSIREQANMVWRFHDQSHQVRLYGPLGAGAVKLEFDDYGVQLSDSKGIVHVGDSAQDLLTEITGWPIPVQALSYWLFVQPNPDLPFRYQLDADGQVALIEQSGWRIHYSDFRDYAPTIENESEPQNQLPRKLTAEKRVGPGAEDIVSVKLITKEWQF